MATFTGQSIPSLKPDQPSIQRLIGRYQLAVDGAVVGTNKSIGSLRKGSMINGNQIQVRVDVAGANTDTIAVFLVPRSTTTIDTSGIYAATAVTTTGILRGTDAQVKTATRFARLAEDCEVIVQYSAADGTGTLGDFTVIIPFEHDLDLTTYGP